MKFPWNAPVYFDNSDGRWDFMPEQHRPGGKDPLHSDWRWPFSDIPRTYTAFEFLSAYTIEGDPKHWVNGATLEQHKGPWHSLSNSTPGFWVPKPWGLPGTYQKTTIVYFDPVSEKRLYGTYRSRVYSNGLGWRIGPRLSDDDVAGKPAFYVNAVPEPYGFLTFQIKRIKEKT